MTTSPVGYMKINVFTASNAFPVADATVRVYGNEEQNGGFDFSIKTNRNGNTDVIELPAPSASLSMSPNAPEQPFSTYNLEISAQGYYPKTLVDVAIFQGIMSIIPVEMFPDAGLKRDTPIADSNNSIIYENEDLQ